LFRVADVDAALGRLERGEVCPPDRIESDRVTKSKERNGHAYVPKSKKVRPTLSDLVFNLDEL
jgi:hypothetical protein